ncbi:hypothetical protein [Treponema sp. R8-4-B8]
MPLFGNIPTSIHDTTSGFSYLDKNGERKYFMLMSNLLISIKYFLSPFLSR